MQLFRQQAEKLHQKLVERADRKVFDVWEVVVSGVMELTVRITCGARPVKEYSNILEE